jgi:TM2 domain-containing membrane protein YozV
MYSVIGADGQLYGPVDLATLKQWCIEGRILATTSMVASGTGQSLRASDVRELQPYLQQMPNQGPFHGQGPFQQPQGPYAHPQTPYQQPQNPYQPPTGLQQPGAFGGQPGPYSNPPGPYQPSAFSQGYYRQPYGVAAPKSKVAAGLLAFFLGGLGIHRFYLGYNRDGGIMLGVSVASLFICQIGLLVTAIWALIDTVKIFSGTLPDAYGQPLY